MAKDKAVFKMINKDVLDKLEEDGDIVMPKKKVSVPKDKLWNTQQMTSKIMQGLQAGSSIDDISKSLKSVIGNNEASAIRNARTMVTSAECGGRLDSYKSLAAQGVVQKKVWMATPDDRTRPSHVDIDGEEQDIDKPFSNGCMYPGDGKGPAEEVWMCRCTMTDHIIGFRKADGSISYVNYDGDKTMHDEQMDAEKERRKNGEQSNIGVVNGKDISETWTRRPDKFDFEIEDIINAQGFDGLPRVVSADEFDRYVEESKFIAQRTYSAPDQETLDAYREQLYNGKWYVDCSKGGAQYGQGMYCAADYEGKLTDGIKAEMNHYKEVGESRFSMSTMPVSYTETLTLDPSAKIIKYDDLWEMRQSIEQETIVKYVDSALNDVLKSKNLDNNIDAKMFMEFQTQTGNISWQDVTKAHDNLQKAGLIDEVNALIPEANKAKMAAVDKGVEEWNRDKYKYNDLGVLATSKGYDAINAEGHGESSSYTVILNRTKCIFKGE